MMSFFTNFILGKKRSPFNSYEVELAERRVINLIKQQQEDRKFERDVVYSAEMMLIDYNSQQDFIINGVNYGKMVPIVAPLSRMYMVYDWDTAKYKSASFGDMIRDKFKELLEQQNSK